MIENIGKVKLNLEYYGGKDLYSDGAIEIGRASCRERVSA